MLRLFLLLLLLQATIPFTTATRAPGACYFAYSNDPLFALPLSLSPLSPIRHPPSLTPLSKRRKGIDATHDSCDRGNILWVFGESFRCFNFFSVLTCLNWKEDDVEGINVAKIYFFLRERGGREYWLFFFYFSLVKENWKKFAIVSIMQCIIIFVRIINVGRRGGCVAKPSAAEL